MWHEIFEERYGRAFADEHLRVQAEFKSVEAGEGPYEFLFWSIQVI